MKKLITLLEISSSEFKSKLKSVGNAEKGNELTSGGELQSDFLDILSKFMDDWKKLKSNCPLTFTSGNDAFHKKITSYTSRHTKGEAVDVTLDSSCHSSFKSLLDSYKTKYNGFSYIDEYTNPTAKATGGHFHISYRSGQPEGSKKNSSTESGLTNNDDTTTTTYVDGKPELGGDLLSAGLSKIMSLNNENFFKNKRTLESINRIKNLL
jgi:hypothetical protein